MSDAPASIAASTAPVAGDREFIDAILAGDRKAIARFVTLHTDAVYRYVSQRLDRPEGADDLVLLH